ncbi:hypothetical protein F2Q69_00016905 [Brassica cretica]|uniref:Uncharacterized protein n=1 Tax=Brassica cretica TaxID=69181 RepID=A0A8S9QYX3_BRACR|nr:hypothetical protein F2Q69_00016905 [Brassica cretica]
MMSCIMEALSVIRTLVMVAAVLYWFHSSISDMQSLIKVTFLKASLHCHKTNEHLQPLYHLSKWHLLDNNKGNLLEKFRVQGLKRNNNKDNEKNTKGGDSNSHFLWRSSSSLSDILLLSQLSEGFVAIVP